MQVYRAIFKNETLTFTEEQGFRNRLDVYNHICSNRLGKTYGRLIEIRCEVLPR